MSKSKSLLSLFISRPTDRDLLQKFLQNSGYSVTTVIPTSLEEWAKVSMIITDDVSAKKFGKELLSIKTKLEPVFLPMLIVLPQSTNSFQWLKSGIDEALHLPLIKEELLNKLSTLLRLRDQTETQYRFIFENISIGIYQMSPENRIILCNPAFAQILGYKSPADVLNKTLEETDTHIEIKRKNFMDILQENKNVINYESVWIRHDGKQICIKENAILMTTGNKNSVYYAGTIEDITVYKEMVRALLTSEDKHRKLVEYSPYGIVILINEKISFVNNAFVKMLRQTEQNVFIDKYIYDYIQVDFQEVMKKQISHVQMSNTISKTIELNFIRIDGSVIVTEVLVCPFNYENAPALQIIVNDISDRIQAEIKINHMVHHDYLTGLPNRLKLESILNESLQQSKRNHTHFAILFIDLDLFKNINDTLGHPVGDLLLREVAIRLQRSVRLTDKVARLAGDEFVIVINNISNINTLAMSITNKVRDILSEPIFLQEYEVHITASIGISIYPQDGEDTDTLLKNADIAMYSVKNTTRNNFQFCTPELTHRLWAKATLEKQLHNALAHNEFSMHYQPKFSLKTGCITGIEALLRWNNPDIEYIGPEVFIPVAEETGLILPITELVLNEVGKQIQAWQLEKFTMPSVAINLSVRNFSTPGLMTLIKHILEKYDINPAIIEFEITESTLIQDIASNLIILQQLKKLGMKISLDDFGTGYASLSYLRRFAIDSLKIDKSFILDINTNTNNAVIVDAIIAMTHSLNITVIGEGVETLEQQAYLKSHGCDEIQGYYFCKPLEANALVKFIKVYDKSKLKK